MCAFLCCFFFAGGCFLFYFCDNAPKLISMYQNIVAWWTISPQRRWRILFPSPEEKSIFGDLLKFFPMQLFSLCLIPFEGSHCPPGPQFFFQKKTKMTPMVIPSPPPWSNKNPAGLGPAGPQTRSLPLPGRPRSDSRTGPKHEIRVPVLASLQMKLAIMHHVCVCAGEGLNIFFKFFCLSFWFFFDFWLSKVCFICWICFVLVWFVAGNHANWEKLYIPRIIRQEIKKLLWIFYYLSTFFCYFEICGLKSCLETAGSQTDKSFHHHQFMHRSYTYVISGTSIHRLPEDWGEGQLNPVVRSPLWGLCHLHYFFFQMHKKRGVILGLIPKELGWPTFGRAGCGAGFYCRLKLSKYNCLKLFKPVCQFLLLYKSNRSFIDVHLWGPRTVKQ